MQEGSFQELQLSSSGGPAKKLVSEQPLKSFQAEMGRGPGEVNRGLCFGSAGARANSQPR